MLVWLCPWGRGQHPTAGARAPGPPARSRPSQDYSQDSRPAPELQATLPFHKPRVPQHHFRESESGLPLVAPRGALQHVGRGADSEHGKPPLLLCARTPGGGRIRPRLVVPAPFPAAPRGSCRHHPLNLLLHQGVGHLLAVLLGRQHRPLCDGCHVGGRQGKLHANRVADAPLQEGVLGSRRHPPPPDLPGQVHDIVGARLLAVGAQQLPLLPAPTGHRGGSGVEVRVTEWRCDRELPRQISSALILRSVLISVALQLSIRGRIGALSPRRCTGK
mmetsp:Transcript_57966/g.184059  ORF Transcript_57966/g.184059 Transcript_57966/m.184059 type:complete len:275 (+) Transcript_57966:374-1198(+)